MRSAHSLPTGTLGSPQGARQAGQLRPLDRRVRDRICSARLVPERSIPTMKIMPSPSHLVDTGSSRLKPAPPR